MYVGSSPCDFLDCCYWHALQAAKSWHLVLALFRWQNLTAEVGLRCTSHELIISIIILVSTFLVSTPLLANPIAVSMTEPCKYNVSRVILVSTFYSKRC